MFINDQSTTGTIKAVSTPSYDARALSGTENGTAINNDKRHPMQNRFKQTYVTGSFY